jgi:hypothetical protein
MLKPIFFVIKLAVFASAVLVLGNLVHWQGRTVSDQVKLRMASAQRSERGLTETAGKLKSWAGDLVSDSRKATRATVSGTTGNQVSVSADKPLDDIHPSERQKLRALIRELNAARGQD